jgi:hypothetical protein
MILMGTTGDERKSTVQTRRVAGADHRATFVTAAPEALGWIKQMK